MINKQKKIIVWTVLIFAIIIFGWLFFKPRFSGDIQIDAIAFGVRGVGIHWYGLLIAVAIFAGYEIFVKPRLKQNNINEENFTTWLLLVVLAGLVGARIGYIIQSPSYYFAKFSEIFAVWHGGMSIHGAIVAGLLMAWLAAVKMKINILKMFDLLSPAVIFAMAIGRLGNYFNQELIGEPTNVPWKMYVAMVYRPCQYTNVNYYHPVFLYEMIFDFIILVIILHVSKKTKSPGVVFFAFLGLYSIGRFIVEIWRYNPTHYFWGLTLAQFVSIGLVMISLVAIWILRKKNKNNS